MEMVVVRNTSGSKTPIPVLEVPAVVKGSCFSFAEGWKTVNGVSAANVN
jgi:hypothetical protein